MFKEANEACRPQTEGDSFLPCIQAERLSVHLGPFLCKAGREEGENLQTDGAPRLNSPMHEVYNF